MRRGGSVNGPHIGAFYRPGEAMEPSARPQGSYSHQTQVQRTENGYTRNSTAPNAQGQTTTRNATGTYDPSTKTWTKDVSVNRSDGG